MISDAARRYCAMGWAVFPLAYGSKQPLAGTSGLLDASSDPASLADWPGRCNIGIATGPSGLVVIDVDVPKCDGDPDGHATLAELVGSNEWPDPPMAQTTRNGGTQFVFLAPQGVEYKSIPSVWPGIDVRATGGYVVAPPSTVEPDPYCTDGPGTYSWVTPCPQEPPPLPAWLADLLPLKGAPPRDAVPPPKAVEAGGLSRYVETALERECDAVASCPAGSRNAVLNKAAYAIGKYVGGGEISEGEAFNALWQAADRCGLLSDPNDGPGRTKNTIQSGLRGGMKHPKSVPDPTPARGRSRIEAPVDDSPPPDDGDAPDDQSWRDMLLTTKNGIQSCPANAMIYTRALLGHKLAYDERSQTSVWSSAPPWDPGSPQRALDGDLDRSECCRWLAARERVSLSPDHLWGGMVAASKLNSYDLVVDYLRGLPEHDGEDRISSWLTTYAGVAVDDDYVRAVARAWLVSAVARALSPGCKVDHILVLEGSQGIGKSSILEALAGEFYAEVSIDVTSKDSVLAIHGPWICDWGELAGLSGKHVEPTKAYLTRSEDRVRLPYGRHHVDLPRRSVFAATTNASQWLSDTTGGRRFWPVMVRHRTRVDAMRRDRDLLWAEALERYLAGEQWWLSAAEEQLASEEQEERLEMDSWGERLESQLNDVGGARYENAWVQMEDLMDIVGLPSYQQTSTASHRISRHMQRLGWSRARRRVGARRVRVFLRPGHEESTDNESIGA